MDAAELGHAVTLVVSDPAQAHQAVTDLYRQMLKPMTLQGKTMQITACEHEEDRSVDANRYYWGYVLKPISEQAVVLGERWMAEAWHNLFKRLFLGYHVRKEVVAGQKRKRVIRELRSTSKPPLKLKAWHRYIDQVCAYGVNELGVTFPDPPDWWQR